MAPRCVKGGEEKETYVSVENRYEIDPRHQQIVSHVILALYTGGGTEVGAYGDIGGTGHIAGLFKTEEAGEGWKFSRINKRKTRRKKSQGEGEMVDIQISSVIPDWA